MQIPDGLPPSFKGTAVQYVYTLEAHAALSDDSLVRIPAPARLTSLPRLTIASSGQQVPVVIERSTLLR